MAGYIVSIIAIIVACLAIAVPFGIEVLKRPKLDIAVGKSTGDERGFRILHITVLNERRRGWFGKIVQRGLAPLCHVDLTFYDPSLRAKEFPPIRGRWSPTPEPVFLGQFDQARVSEGERWDLAPSDDGETVAVAIKHKDEQECYAFNGLSYHPSCQPGWKKRDWMLTKGEYIVKTTAISGDVSHTAYFILKNWAKELESFALEPVSIEDVQRLHLSQLF
ncbi:hypothetical protein ES703_54924 [subsurface metagenome]